jgi:hypothetical protein
MFGSDLNYSVEVKLIGIARQRSRSLTGKKWLIVYDPPPVNKEQYSPTWIYLANKSISYEVIDPIKGNKKKHCYLILKVKMVKLKNDVVQ